MSQDTFSPQPDAAPNHAWWQALPGLVWVVADSGEDVYVSPALMERATSANTRSFQERLTAQARQDVFDCMARRTDFQLALECSSDSDALGAFSRQFDCSSKWMPEERAFLCVLVDVSSARQAARECRAQSDFLDRFCNALPAMLAYYDFAMKCQYANRHYAELYGFTERSILGKPLSEVVGEIDLQTRPLRKQTYTESRTTHFERLFMRPGGIRWVRGIIQPLMDAQGRRIASASMNQDVTSRHLIERALEASESRLSKFMEASTEGVLFHRDGVITDANPAACKLYGADLSSLLGKSIFDFVTPDHLGTALRTVALPTDARLESEIVTAQGERIPVEVIGRSLLRFGEQLRMVILRDIRDRRQAQVRIQELIMGLRTEKDRAEGADRAKSVFLAAASHDLRQPIHALGLFLTALRSMAQAPSVPAAELGLICRRMQASLDGLGQLLNMLLDVSRLDANAVEVTRGPSSLAQLLAELDQEFQPLAQEKGLRLRMVNSALWVHTDLTVLRRILANLLSNAVRYTHRGRILLVCRSRAQEVEIQVWDQGIGIADEQREAIFEEFYQIGPSTARNHESHGMGLGLSIVKRSAQLLQAPLQVRSQPGHGSMFSIRLPRCEAPAQALGTASEPAYARTANSRGVLVIDDDAQVLHAMHSVLTAWGHRVFCAHSPDEAVLMAAQHGTQIDVLISDYRLGGVVTAVETIQAVHTCLQREIPTYILTGDTSPQRIQEASILGFPLVHKPVDAHTLRALMDAPGNATVARGLA
ncbi:PAS domain-containing hybrid sensor histidine kinase/response regulator [Hydrogenophaga sp. BPS33]|uniref:PAS domain-containing hybrid sensor histidine kinase/response regulator n=1 Tax=Hydrogenophaga sp. BPS33 TaxID=2651974 RepID=UPI00131F8277|nr:PAS domain S-box protein [Hydrogenophaga sp. BPS33]QHE88319.1 PAS domain S-box protein [Hydrogenophaga sp. BPS33]